MTEPLYQPIPGQPPFWLRPREPENEARQLRLMLELERLVCSRAQLPKEQRRE